jgi:hypothetical protein
MIAMVLIIGMWNVYRVGSFVITTGAALNPMLALAQADKISPVLDQDHPIDRAPREKMKQFSFQELLEVNEGLQRELGIRAPGLASLAAKRYLSAWQHHPVAMARHIGANWEIAKFIFTSTFIYDNGAIPPLWWSQQLMVWGLIVCPIAWALIGLCLPMLHRQARLVLSLWAFSASIIAFYAAMFFEPRYALPTLGPVLMILALSIGAAMELPLVGWRLIALPAIQNRLPRRFPLRYSGSAPQTSRAELGGASAAG